MGLVTINSYPRYVNRAGKPVATKRTAKYTSGVCRKKGFEKKLSLVGVGYKAQAQGAKLSLNVGYSHPVTIPERDGVTIEVPAPNKIVVSGADKQAVGQLAAEIRGVRPPEPYLGKGIRYEGEYVRRKAGKAGK